MSIINDPTKGRKYRRQLTVLVMVLFVFCRSILPTKQINIPINVQNSKVAAKSSLDKNQAKNSEWTKDDVANLFVLGAFLYVLYEFVDSILPSSAERAASNREYQRRESMKAEGDRKMIWAQQQEKRYEADRQMQKEAY
jgi:hypothetical protein